MGLLGYELYLYLHFSVMKFNILKLHTHFFGTGATVEPYGSFVSNLFTRWGDLDISIELSNGSHISSIGKNQKQRLLGDLIKALKLKGNLLPRESWSRNIVFVDTT